MTALLQKLKNYYMFIETNIHFLYFYFQYLYSIFCSMRYLTYFPYTHVPFVLHILM
jgi:hypothetical protein